MSSYSTTSNNSQNRSRPPSHAFPTFHSSLPYALVRDFAYPIIHPNHYGPPPETSAVSTPASEAPRRLSDPSNSTWDGADPQWSAGPWGGDGFFATQQLPQTAYGDGPPYSEDEDLHSPVVVSSRHKKHKSTSAAIAGGQTKGKSRNSRHGEEEGEYDFNERSYFANGIRMYHIGEGDETEGDLVTYPPDQARQSLLAPSTYGIAGQRDSHFATLPNRSYRQDEITDSDDDSLLQPENGNDSRYSKDYQFTIASPDEEMHGKAVALFDFERENENELPLVEGQVIWVSYRHGQGWLVAEDPKTGESGLVPEEYVRLLRDIEGGWTSLSGEEPTNNEDRNSPIPLSPNPPDSANTPTQRDPKPGHSAHSSNGSRSDTKENRPPVVSTFSTSSKDLSPYPHRLLEKERGQTPPLVVHYGSLNNTPMAGSPAVGVDLGRDAHAGRGRSEEEREGETEDETEESGGDGDSSREDAQEEKR